MKQRNLHVFLYGSFAQEGFSKILNTLSERGAVGAHTFMPAGGSMNRQDSAMVDVTTSSGDAELTRALKAIPGLHSVDIKPKETEDEQNDVA